MHIHIPDLGHNQEVIVTWGKMPSMAFAHSTLQSNPARPDLLPTWCLLRTEAFHIEIPFKTRPSAVCVHVCAAALGSWREPREPRARAKGTRRFPSTPTGGDFTGAGEEEALSYSHAAAQTHLELDASIAQRIPMFWIRNQEFDSFDIQNDRHLGELGCLNHPGRRHKNDGMDQSCT